jgi:2-polyprenyl-3-methyl-5-hydroxy-6-metoxy-1,4-benzoquinol methylase
MESSKWTESPLKEKFLNIPDLYYRQRLSTVNFNPEGARILDFGCGSGLITAGIACFLRPELVVGVDIVDYVNHQENEAVAKNFGFDYQSVMERIEFRTINALASLPRDYFDCVLSWSVVEHINRDVLISEIIELRQSLVTNGVMVIQSAPLYFSPYGSHVYSLPPWSHLILSEDNFRSVVLKNENSGRAEALISCKESLNRVTIDDLSSIFISAGFKIEELYITGTELAPPSDLSSIYQDNILKQEQGVWTLRKI